MKEAAIGSDSTARGAASAGFEPERIAAHLENCAGEIERATLTGVIAEVAHPTAVNLRAIAQEVKAAPMNLEELDRRLTVMEEKIFSALLAGTPEDELVALREESARSLAPYRSRMQTAQIRQVEQQFLHKRLLEKYALPRLSLFYMS